MFPVNSTDERPPLSNGIEDFRVRALSRVGSIHVK